MTDFFETRMQNLEPKEDKKKKSSAAAKNSNKKKSLKKRKQQTLTQVLYNQRRIFYETKGQSRNTAFYNINEVILQTISRIDVLWSTSTSGNKDKV